MCLGSDVLVKVCKQLTTLNYYVYLCTVMKKIGITLLAILTVLAPQVQAQDRALAKRAAAKHNLEVAKNMDIFTQVYKNLDRFYVDTLNPSEVIGTGIKAMLRQLDPYTEYYPESETNNLKMMLTGKYAGIGALVRYHLVQKNVVIDEPYEGMPAAEVGLKKGDIILSIDDSVMTDREVSYVSSRLRGDAGTQFVLRIRRPSTGKTMDFKITRRSIKLPELPYYGIVNQHGAASDDGGKIGYINLNQFTEGCSKDVRRAFIDLKKQGITALIFDLRGNGGGSEMEAVDIVNLWVDKEQTIVENRGKISQANHAYKTRLEPVDTQMPLVVLVNGETASASEITSGALQDLDRAVVLGTRTYGKGLVQIPLDMPYNTNLKLTTSKYYIPSGRCIQAINYRRGGTGGYRERVADSLTHVFHTAAGREVRDGGGITPDVEIKNDTIPNIAFYLSVSGQDSTEVMFDWVVNYISRHPTIAPAREFHLTDDEFNDFKQHVIKSGFSYDPVSKKQLDELKKTAKAEGYYEQASEAFDLLESKLRHDVATDLDKHDAMLRQMLEMEIVTAYYYQAGSIEAGLQYDKQLKEAVRLLQSPEEYKNLLTPKQ
mgnify:CR=1 FL=1